MGALDLKEKVSPNFQIADVITFSRWRLAKRGKKLVFG